MRITVSEYAKVHGLSVRTAYRRVHHRDPVPGDTAIVGAGQALIECMHVGKESLQQQGQASGVPILEVAPQKTPDSRTSTASPLQVLIRTMNKLGVWNPDELAHIVDEWSTFSPDAQTAVSGSPLAIENFVNQNREEELLLRERVEAEGWSRRSASRVACASFDRLSKCCRFLKDRRTGRPFLPSVIDCALCRHYRAVGVRP